MRFRDTIICCLVMLLPQICLADFLCKGEVSYKWMATGAEEGQSELFQAVQAESVEEEQAKAKLQERAVRVKTQALEECRREHENVSGCIASRYQQMTSVSRHLTFSGRKELEKAIAEDCKLKQGKCKEASLSEPVCEESLKKGKKGKG